MGLFYEHVQNDSNIDQNVISSIDAISIPLLRLATANMKFLRMTSTLPENIQNIIQASQNGMEPRLLMIYRNSVSTLQEILMKWYRF